ncbi:MAG: hypothetical protein KDE47_18435, partial [Caldilineaceae bacterium]|nr:hypothetical protein [Caldilineaceae bacterium]
TALSFPWLFVDRWPVWTICGVGALILLALRKIPCLRQRLGRTLHDVQRDSTGELLFPVAIALLYGLAAEPVTYAVPVAILTLADTAAALVGLQWGRHPFAIPDGRKSWEGVVAFAVSTIMVTIPLLFWLTALPWPALLLAATVVLLLTTLTEAVAWHGHDNLLVPLAGYLALRLTLAQPVPVLLSQLLIVAGLALLFVPLWQQLPPHTTLTGLLTLTALWLGGPLL